ncbi:MAG TPA: hypothetical protein PLP86_06230 [Armatimonadota bacterium]|nr:hypothetical protein [Armatimonadota bacterium]
MPSLESVKSGSGPGLLAYTVFCLMLLLTILPFLIIASGFSDDNIVSYWEINLAATCIAAAASIFWLMRRSSSFDGYWETDSQGLKASGLFRTVYIRWEDITHASTKWANIVIGRVHWLQAGGKTVLVPAGDLFLGLSIRQHLHRIGAAEGIKLSDEAERLIAPISEEVPDQIAWTTDNPPNLVYHMALTLLIIGVAVTAASWFLVKEDRLLAYLFIPVALILFEDTIKKPWIDLFTATRASVNSDRLRVDTTLRTLTILWNSIVTSEWQGRTIVLKAKPGGRVAIPWNTSEENSTLLILSIIRHLRSVSRHVQLPVPRELIQSKPEANEDQ